MNIKKGVVVRIQSICAERKMTINALANMSGITPSSLYSMIDSDRNDIGIVLIKKICDGLEISMSEFFDDDIFYKMEQEIK